MKTTVLKLFITIMLLNITLAHALNIEITKKEIHDNYKEDIDGLGKFTHKYTYLKLKLNNNKQTINNLRVGVIDNIEEAEAVTFTYPDKTTVTLPEDIGLRFLKILAQGWSNETTFYSQEIGERYGYDFDEYPTCMNIMFYLTFNIKNYYVPPNIEKIYISSPTPDSQRTFKTGDLIVIRNPAIPEDNNTVMYLGNSYYLIWRWGRSVFQVQHLEHLLEESPKNASYAMIVSAQPSL